jgi:hypothetical protein
MIRATRRLLGAPISPELAQTQKQAGDSLPATCVDGVIFAYASLEKTRQEGVRKEILKITYSSAVAALQTKEAAELARLNQNMGPGGFRHLIEPTLLILVGDVVDFDFME